MTAINHAVTGACIGLIAGNPYVALPAALISHFVCDAIPHWKPNEPDEQRLRTRSFRNYLLADASACAALVTLLAIFRPDNWLLASACAFLAASPDFLWIPKYLSAIDNGKEWKNWFTRFAAGIQWFQRPIGAVVEVAWFIAATFIIQIFVTA